jgi:hypothetical protein
LKARLSPSGPFLAPTPNSALFFHGSYKGTGVPQIIPLPFTPKEILIVRPLFGFTAETFYNTVDMGNITLFTLALLNILVPNRLILGISGFKVDFGANVLGDDYTFTAFG